MGSDRSCEQNRLVVGNQESCLQGLAGGVAPAEQSPAEGTAHAFVALLVLARDGRDVGKCGDVGHVGHGGTGDVPGHFCLLDLEVLLPL